MFTMTEREVNLNGLEKRAALKAREEEALEAREWPAGVLEVAEDKRGLVKDVARALGTGGGQQPLRAGRIERQRTLGLLEDGREKGLEAAGRKRAPSLVRATKRYLQENPGALDLVAKALVYKAQEGDPAVLRMLFDRLDGAVVQKQLTADVVVKRLNVGLEDIREVDVEQIEAEAGGAERHGGEDVSEVRDDAGGGSAAGD